MKHIRWITLMVMIALLAACAPAAATENKSPDASAGYPVLEPTAYPVPVTEPTQAGYPAPVEVPTAVGYPAPGAANLPEACRPEGMQTYSDPAGRYCFAYPANFTLDASGEGSPMLVGPALDSADMPVARLLMFSTRLADGQDLKSIVQSLMTKYGQENSTVIIQQNDLTIGNEPATSLEPVPGEAGSRDYLLVHGGEVIMLRFEPNVETNPAARPDRDALIDIVIKSFTWLK